jgi:hypothetical protein
MTLILEITPLSTQIKNPRRSKITCNSLFRKFDFLKQFIKIKIQPVFIIRPTAEISKIFVKILNDLGKAKIEISYLIQIELSSVTSENYKKSNDSDLAKRLNTLY